MTIFEKTLDFGGVLRFEAGIFAGRFVGGGDVLAGAVTECGVFEENVPGMVFFFHLVALVFDAEFLLLAALRFEAIFGLAPFGS
jgi:hypothetical protein